MNCACHKQIVWFFDKPTVLVCTVCEKTFHFDAINCDECGDALVEFTAEIEDIYPKEDA